MPDKQLEEGSTSEIDVPAVADQTPVEAPAEKPAIMRESETLTNVVVSSAPEEKANIDTAHKNSTQKHALFITHSLLWVISLLFVVARKQTSYSGNRFAKKKEYESTRFDILISDNGIL